MWKTFLIGVAAVTLFGTDARGATVTTSNCISTYDCAVTIENLAIGSGSYNVYFVRATYADFNANYPNTFFGDQTGAQDAVDAINAVLETEGLVLVQDGPTPATNNSNYLVPYAFPGPDFSAVQGFRNGPLTGFTWDSQDSNFDATVGSTFAVISPIPIPAAFWLLGSALGVLGWARRRASTQ